MSKTAKPASAPVSSRYLFFLWATLFLTLAYLVVQNDVATVWPGAEGRLLYLAAAGDTAWYPPALLARALAVGDLWLFWPRLVSVGSLVLAGWLFWRWGRPLFGRQTVEAALLVVAGSLFLPLLGKVAAADAQVLLLQLGAWLCVLRYVKRPEEQGWLIAHLACTLLAGWWAPLSTFIFLPLYNRLLFKGDRRLWLLTLVAAGAGGGINLLSGSKEVASAALYFTPLHGPESYGIFLLYSLLGLLPFVGFLLAGIRDLFYKIRRGEELSRLLGVALALTLVAQSPLFPFILAFVAAKQIQACLQPNYPWGNYVKSGAVLHLIFVAIGAIFGLLVIVAEYSGEGFRAVLGLVAAYWLFSLVAVLGLFGGRRDYVLAGTVLAGVLSLLFFWVQVYPYLEVERNWPQRLVRALQRPPGDAEAPLILPAASTAVMAAPYLHRAGFSLALPADQAAALTVFMEAATPTLLLLPADSTTVAPAGATPVLSVDGRGIFRREQWQVYSRQ